MRYAIGDIHGCRETLGRLLETIDFAPNEDELWLVGDLVNGGPESLAVVRWAREHADSIRMVPGNHDLHMLAVAHGAQPMREDDTFRPLLEAPDRHELIEWLKRRPMMHRDDDYVLVHAGLHPAWDVEEAVELARSLESILRADRAADLLDEMYGDEPEVWASSLSGIERWRFVINAMSRMRAVRRNDRGMDFEFKGRLDQMPDELVPWFEARSSGAEEPEILFGHWSALGPHRASNAVCLDGGCTWGHELVAMRLEDGRMFRVESELPRVEFD